MPIIRDDQQGKLVKSPPRKKTPVPAVPRRTTRSASPGDPHVATVQRQLRAAGINVAVDGIYGPQTDAAIRHYNAGLSQRNADARHATANVIKTQYTEPRQAAPPIMVPRTNTAKAQPGKAPTTRRSYTPFYPGQKPDYHERVRTAGRGPATSGKRRAVYTIPEGQQMTGLEFAAGRADNPLAALGVAQGIRTDARGGPLGSAFRGLLEEAPTLVGGKTVQRLAADEPIKLGQTAEDIGNIALNVVAPAKLAAVGAAFGLHGSEAARAFVAALRDGASVRDAAETARFASATAGTARGTARATAPGQGSRDVMAALKGDRSRAGVHAEIDLQVADKAHAAAIKQGLDQHIIEQADAIAKTRKEGTLRARRQQVAVDKYREIASHSRGNPFVFDEVTVAANQARRTRINKLREMPRANKRITDKDGIPVQGRTTVEDVLKRLTVATPDKAQRAIDAGFYGDVRPVLNAIADDPEIMGWLASQRAASPARGITDLMRVLDAVREGREIPSKGPGSIGVSAKTIEQLVRGETGLTEGARAKISDFTDAALRKRTRTWMGGHPDFGGPGVVDRWGYRSWGFADKEWQKLNPHLKADKINDDVYEFIARRYQELADQMNKVRFDGRKDWTIEEAQAMDWAAIQRYHGVHPEGMRYAFDMNARTLQTQAAPAEITDMLERHNVRLAAEPVTDQNGSTSVRVMGSPEGYQSLAQELADQYGQVWVMRNVGSKTNKHLLTISGDNADELVARAEEMGFTHARWLGDHWEVFAPEGGVKQKAVDEFLKDAGSGVSASKLELEVVHGRAGARSHPDLPAAAPDSGGVGAEAGAGQGAAERPGRPDVRFTEGSSPEHIAAFVDAAQSNPRRAFLTEYSPEDLANHRVFLSEDGHVGYALSPEGDLQSVFSNPGALRGAGRAAVEHAVENGARTLDAFDGFLPDLYREHGFVETGRMRWVDEYAPDGWDHKEYDSPDVVFMSREAPEQTGRYFTDWDEGKAASRVHENAIPGLDVPHPGDVFPAHWTDKGEGPGLTAVYDDARDWLADVVWANMEPEDMHDLSDLVVARAIDKYYDGGMDQFISDSLYVDPLGPPGAEAAKPIPMAFQMERPFHDYGSTLADRHLTQAAVDWQEKLLDDFGNPVMSARFASGAQQADPEWNKYINMLNIDTPLDASQHAELERLHDKFGVTKPSAPVARNPAVAAAIEDPYAARVLTAGGLTAQFAQPPSILARHGLGRYSPTRAAVRWIDQASAELDHSEFVHKLPGVKNITSSRRVVKQAGRNQRDAMSSRYAKMARHVRVLEKLKEGSGEDVAHFWYAQLPASHRNAEGLQAIVDMQSAHLEDMTNGSMAARVDAHEEALKISIKEAATGGEVRKILAEVKKLQQYRRDIPNQMLDTAASVAVLKNLVAHAPTVNEDVIAAMRALAEDRKRILIRGRRLKPDEAAGREQKLSIALGIEPDGSEVYVGHRLPEPQPEGSYSPPSGGTKRVRSPKGAGIRNELILAKNGRLRATTRVNYEDWSSTNGVFEAANIARDDLAKLGPKWNGKPVPEDSVLVDAKGETIPKHLRTDELSQFTDDAVEREEIRKQAEDILRGFIAFDPSQQSSMIEKANQLYIDEGELPDIRIVKRTLVDRYYKQFRYGDRGGAAKNYDHIVDGVSLSIIFARIGYIPKNMVQNLVMALPHQGAFLLQNGVRAGQVLNDFRFKGEETLKDLILGQVSGSGATSSMGKEFVGRKVQKGITGFVTGLADDPARISAWLHVAANHGIIPRYGFMLTSKQKQTLIDFISHPKNEQQLHDITREAIESMGDFARLNPTQARWARRLLIIPGWLVAGSRYPFHFAATHPARAALIAYALAGEPGAPKELQFNQPITEYLHGDKYLIGFDTRWGRLRVSSLSPISTPEELGRDILGSVTGKKSPFDYDTPTAFDVVQPALALGTRFVRGELHLTTAGGWEKGVLKPLVPNYGLIKDLVTRDGHSPHYPDDDTWWKRLEREVGIAPIRVVDDIPKKRKSTRRQGTKEAPAFGGGGGGGGSFGGGGGSGGFGG